MTTDDGLRRRMELSSETLRRLDPRISIPSYDRGALGGGIVHIGVGGFHRAHQAVYLDDLCRAGVTEWSISGAGVLAGDAAMAAALGAQDDLYTLVTRDSRATDVRVIGAITDYVLAVDDIEPLVARISDPDTRIVSMTITEGGYPVDEASGAFLAPPAGALPPTFEALARAFGRRRDAGLGGLTVQSCDNVMGNGDTAKTATLGVCAMVDPGLEDWVEQNVSFPNSMVDRITPQTSDADREFLAPSTGWSIDGPSSRSPSSSGSSRTQFAQGRPPYEDAGALITHDVRPYETLKLRILNAGHSTTGLHGRARRPCLHPRVSLADPLLAQFLRRFHDDEVTPSLPPVPGIDVEDYKRVVAERFANPEVRDQVARVCLDGTSKFPKFLVPTIESQLDKGGPVSLSALALAGWCQYLLGKDDQGREIVALCRSAAGRGGRVRSGIAGRAGRLPRLHGCLRLARSPADPRFVAAFVDALASIREAGNVPYA